MMKNVFKILTFFTLGLTLGLILFTTLYTNIREKHRKGNWVEFIGERFNSPGRDVIVDIIPGPAGGDKTITAKPTRDNEDVDQLVAILEKKMKEMEKAGMLKSMLPVDKCTPQTPVAGPKCTCHETNCSSMPSNTSPENIRKLRTPVHKVGLEKLQQARKVFNLTDTGKKYVFITGASSNHFVESQVVLENFQNKVAPHFKNYSLFYYDFGLKEHERQQIRELSKATLLTFPFDKLPNHMRNLMCYTWKPMIALAHLPHSEFTLWMDASLFFHKDIHPYFTQAATTGVTFYDNPYQLPQHTHEGMFTYFGYKPCQFSNFTETEGGFQVWHNEEFTRRLIIEPWSACAMDPNCMCPPASQRLYNCNMKLRKYGKCHRFDQSGMGFVSAMALREHRPSVIIKHSLHSVRQGQRGDYFKRLAKQLNAKKQL